MKIKCCKCKKEYDLSKNIFEYEKNGNPVLICPHCGFKHVINFMPFEKKIKVKRIKKLNLANPYFVILGASRIANDSRIDQSGFDDGNIEEGIAWDIDTFIYSGKSKLVRDQATYPYSMFFSPDGSKMYVVDGFNDTVYQYTLSTAWDVSTAVYAEKSKFVEDQEEHPYGLTFSSDGSKMYITGYYQNTVWQYTLSTAWDVSTAVYADIKKIVTDQEPDPREAVFNSDGSKMYIVGTINNTVYQYTLSTAWDVSTATYADKSKLVSDQTENPFSLAFSSDGSKMYIVCRSYDTVYQYTLSTAWDVSTAVYAEKSKLMNEQGKETSLHDVAFNPDGSKMYVIGTDRDTVYQYKLKTDWIKTNDFILATRFYGSKGAYERAYKLRWKISGGVFADVSNTGAITYNAITDLVDGNALIIGEKLCGVQTDYTWQDGFENEGDNLCPDSGVHTLPDEYYTEFQWALNCSNAEDEAIYEFELWDVTEGTSIGTCLATIKMAVAAGEIQNTTGKASLTSSVISVLSRGKIEDVSGKADINSNIIVSFSRGKIESVSGITNITSNIISILSRGKIKNADGKSDISTSIIAILSRGKIEDVSGKADITSNIDSSIYRIAKANAKSSIITLIESLLSRGKIESVTGKSDINTSIDALLSRGRIESVSGKSSISSIISIILSRGKIENATGKVDITSYITTILNRGIIENVSGTASITTLINALLTISRIWNTSGKSQFDTNIDTILHKIISVSGKATLNTLYDVKISEGKLFDVSGKADINSLININLKRILNVNGKSIFDTLIDIEVNQQFAFTQATLGILMNQSEFDIIETDSTLEVKSNESKLNIKR